MSVCPEAIILIYKLLNMNIFHKLIASLQKAFINPLESNFYDGWMLFFLVFKISDPIHLQYKAWKAIGSQDNFI